MENATHALTMAFAVAVFVIALTVTMVSFNNVKQISDIILYAKDETNYYEYQGATGKGAENRIVGLESIIPTLYKYYKENYTVVFKQGIYNYETGDISEWRYLPVYTTSAERKVNWQKESYNNLMERKYGGGEDLDIFSFDLDEETLRHEPWTGDYNKIKNNLDCFLNGGKFINPKDNKVYINYSTGKLRDGGFIGTYKNAKFVETIAEYAYGSTQEVDSSLSETDLISNREKRMIIYTLIEKN